MYSQTKMFLQAQVVKRTLDIQKSFVRYMCVDLRGLCTAMPQQGLDVPQIHPLLKQMGRKTMP